MSVKDILTIIGTALPLLAALLTFLIKFVKNEKAKKFLVETLKITTILQPLIVKAEEFIDYTGAEKKEFVLNNLTKFAAENNIAIDVERVSMLIDELVKTTKKVNVATDEAITPTN